MPSLTMLGGLKRLGVVIILFVSACGSFQPIETEPTRDDVCQQGALMSQIPEVPEGVLLQSLIFDPHDRVGGYRIYADGQYETRPLGEEWSFDAPLTPEQLEAVRAAIAAAGLEGLQARYQPREPEEDMSVLWIQVVEGETVHNIAVEGSCEVPEINSLSAQLVDIFRDE